MRSTEEEEEEERERGEERVLITVDESSESILCVPFFHCWEIEDIFSNKGFERPHHKTTPSLTTENNR